MLLFNNKGRLSSICFCNFGRLYLVMICVKVIVVDVVVIVVVVGGGGFIYLDEMYK
jgi:hypothetical protein